MATDYMSKNSTHPFRVFDTNAWASDDTFSKQLAHVGLTVYNVYMCLLGLALIGYSGFLINKDNTGFSKLLMVVACYIFAISLLYFVCPYIFSSKVCAALWTAMNIALLCFTIGCIVMSFLPTLYREVIKLDINSSGKRPNAGIFLLYNEQFIQAACILGTIFTLCGLLCWAYLWTNFEGKQSKSVSHRPANVELNRARM